MSINQTELEEIIQVNKNQKANTNDLLYCIVSFIPPSPFALTANFNMAPVSIPTLMHTSIDSISYLLNQFVI